MPLPFRVRYPRRSRPRGGLIPGFTGRGAFFTLIAVAILGSLLVFGRTDQGLGWATSIRVATVRASTWLVATWDRAWGGAEAVVQSPKVREENELLKAQLGEARLREEESRRIEAENSRLRKLLGYAEGLPRKTLPAKIIAVDPGSGGWFRGVWLDRGSIHGVRIRDTVRVPAGLAGKVIQVEPEKCQVLMVTDPDFRAAAILEEARVRGEVKGRGGREMDFVILSEEAKPTPVSTEVATPVPGANLGLPEERVYTPGERVTTSGLGGVFPEGLVIGRVTGRRDDPQGITPILTLVSEVNPASLEFVFIVLGESGP